MRTCRCSAACRPGTRSCLTSDEEKLRAYADPAVRASCTRRWSSTRAPSCPRSASRTNWWDYIWVEEPVLEKNKWMKGKTIGQIAQAQGKGIIDAFLDLVVEEKLETAFLQAENNIDDEAMAKILTHPERDDRAVGRRRARAVPRRLRLLTRLLGEWVREKQIMSAGERGAAADLRLGLDLRPLRPRPAAARHGRRHRDLRPRHREAAARRASCTTSRPAAGASRSRRPASTATFVNGEVLMEDGEHTGALPGRVAAQHLLPRAQRPLKA